jgi:osmotically-inducible protein OsmY
MVALRNREIEQSQASDQRLSVRELAERCLGSNPYLALKNITCEVTQGTLTLRGCLPSYYLKQIAQAAVARIDGVERIDNQIEVIGTALNHASG